LFAVANSDAFTRLIALKHMPMVVSKIAVIVCSDVSSNRLLPECLPLYIYMRMRYI
jgi:hypothetical protein